MLLLIPDGNNAGSAYSYIPFYIKIEKKKYIIKYIVTLQTMHYSLSEI